MSLLYKGALAATGGTGNAYVGYEYTTMITTNAYPATEIRQSVDVNRNPNTTQPGRFIYEYNHQ